jgi:hypothetical protein
MQTTDYQDLETTREPVAEALSAATANAVHVVNLLRSQAYPS